MPDKIKEAIGVLENSLSPKEYKEWSCEEYRKAKELAITTLKSVDEAKGELPKKIDRLNKGHLQFDREDDISQAIYNEVIDEFAPILAKKNMELKEMKSELYQTVEVLETERDWAKDRMDLFR